jgi:hypothetical protein
MKGSRDLGLRTYMGGHLQQISPRAPCFAWVACDSAEALLTPRPVLSSPPPFPAPLSALALPRRLVPVADALLGMDLNVDLLLILLLLLLLLLLRLLVYPPTPQLSDQECSTSTTTDCTDFDPQTIASIGITPRL